MKILAIETSCDETALSLVECTGDLYDGTFHSHVIADALYSQITLHAQYGGVFPALAKREHVRNIVPLLEHILESAHRNHISKKTISPLTPHDIEYIYNICAHEKEMADTLITFFEKNQQIPDIDYLVVTHGPGLEPALWVGINCAKVLQKMWGIPSLAIDHMEGHIASVLMNNKHSITFPAIALLISGGHTELVLVKDWGDYYCIGQTRDDAVGEAYDKVARLLGLPYPGGPEISRLAEQYRTHHTGAQALYALPRPMLTSPDFDFSFSGLKTAVLYTVRDITTDKNNFSHDNSNDWKSILAYQFEEAVTEVLVKKTKKALEHFSATSLIVGGGVIANTYIRKKLGEIATSYFIPEKTLATDNATMIALASYVDIKKNKLKILDDTIKANGTLKFDKYTK